MAELQCVVEVRCVNALLAQIKVGERGQHFIVEAPAGDFDPSEFGKLIEGVEEAKAIGDEHYSKLEKKTEEVVGPTQPSFDSCAIEDRDLYDIQLLSTGELAIVRIKVSFFAPSELERFLGDLKKARQQMDIFRETSIA